ncbi:ceramidase domain-containing protein [Cognatazoarcus halotolerans]|uniref:ceramidase domain-containing protein n=1 Tax=Cognatazoarcus halotolerans TaxID=2686016 RepID=UPI001358E519|nr:ceramidase domain-containing protein [Cognatazoarcus halotolerans]MBX3680433.1 ceramidase domain-containing protein [Rhodocyclaceae bacterium]MCB1900024.1 ceramidase domain-containing protein [Rhodocyclaceae bacterium]MCP5310611.1 ceramidase domain-containing protein [Zoogloeaceae bacterium]
MSLHALEPIDLYCERTSALLWAEPVNALSNLAFMFAAWLLLRGMDRGAPADLRALAWLTGLVGAGSLVFHTVAQVWASALDVGFIAIFVIVYLHRALVRLHGWREPGASIAVTAMLVMSAGIAFAARAPALNGSGIYLGPWLALIALALSCRQHLAGRWLRLAAALFAVSILLRSIDKAVCASFPLGTHFGWHLLNAGVLWCCIRALQSADHR